MVAGLFCVYVGSVWKTHRLCTGGY